MSDHETTAAPSSELPATTADGSRPGLSRWQAVPLAIGSVAGSGILFLPSAVYAQAGQNSMIVWIVSTALCLPMLLMFDDMVRSNPDGRGIEAFIRLGLGDVFGRCVPPMFIALVVVGLPSGAFVAGRYVSRAFSLDRGAVIAVAVAVLAAALVVNFVGGRASARVQTIITWALVIAAAVLLVSAVPSADGIDHVIPDGSGLGTVMPGVLLAFWAFAGFENLTFLAREFKDPAKDFLPVSAIALGVYGAFTVLLTIAIAVIVPRGDVDELAGLLQLAQGIGFGSVVIWLVTAIACAAMLLNAVAWVWGVSQLVGDAAETRLLPARFARTSTHGVARPALGLLAVLFTPACLLLAWRPSLAVDTAAAASAIFMLLYILSIISYVRVRGLTLRSGTNLALLLVIAVSLVGSGWQALYGVVVLAVVLAVQLIQRRVRR